MTGIGWVDSAAFAAFVVVTGLTLVRLGRRGDRFRGVDRFLDDAFHTVMGVAMIAMFWPSAGSSPIPAWIVVLGLITVWPLLVLALAARHSPVVGPGSGGNGPAGRVSLAHTGYWLTGGLLMIVAVGAGHGRDGRMSGLAASAPPIGGHGSTGHSVGAGPGALDHALQAIAGWPIWPLVGVGLLLYAGLLLVSLRRPIIERACAAVMAAGMALMAFSL